MKKQVEFYHGDIISNNGDTNFESHKEFLLFQTLGIENRYRAKLS
jgi:hypothetical protein